MGTRLLWSSSGPTEYGFQAWLMRLHLATQFILFSFIFFSSNRNDESDVRLHASFYSCYVPPESRQHRDYNWQTEKLSTRHRFMWRQKENNGEWSQAVVLYEGAWCSCFHLWWGERSISHELRSSLETDESPQSRPYLRVATVSSAYTVYVSINGLGQLQCSVWIDRAPVRRRMTWGKRNKKTVTRRTAGNSL